jgi:hypothetical protein
MATPVQVTFDAADPAGLARFWAVVLGYVEQPPPPGFETWDAFLDSVGVPADQRDTRAAIVDPDGAGPRFFFQKVPEGKTAKNRMHLDVDVGEDHLGAKVSELVALGATELDRFDEWGSSWVVMRDPEGNEFCLQ